MLSGLMIMNRIVFDIKIIEDIWQAIVMILVHKQLYTIYINFFNL